MVSLVVVGIAAEPLPVQGQQAVFDREGAIRRLAAIEEQDPYRLRSLVQDGQPALIAFIDHLCYTCLRSVEPLEELRRRFARRAHVVVVDPARMTAAHSWVKDRYQVWFVPKFVLVSKRGDVAGEYFGPISAQSLAANLQSLLAE